MSRTTYVKIRFSSMSADGLYAYRFMREDGFTRDAANIMMLGAVMVRPELGQAQIKALPGAPPLLKDKSGK